VVPAFWRRWMAASLTSRRWLAQASTNGADAPGGPGLLRPGPGDCKQGGKPAVEPGLGIETSAVDPGRGSWRVGWRCREIGTQHRRQHLSSAYKPAVFRSPAMATCNRVLSRPNPPAPGPPRSGSWPGSGNVSGFHCSNTQRRTRAFSRRPWMDLGATGLHAPANRRDRLAPGGHCAAYAAGRSQSIT